MRGFQHYYNPLTPLELSSQLVKQREENRTAQPVLNKTRRNVIAKLLRIRGLTSHWSSQCVGFCGVAHLTLRFTFFYLQKLLVSHICLSELAYPDPAWRPATLQP